MTTLSEKVKELVGQMVTNRNKLTEDELSLFFFWLGVDPYKDLEAGTLTRFYCKGAEVFGYHTERSISSDWPNFKWEKEMIPLIEITKDGEIIHHYEKLTPEMVRAGLMEWE